MANPPAQAPANVRNVLDFTPGGGAERTPDAVTTASALLPIPLAPSLLGIDAAPFSITITTGVTGQQIITFSALPSRDNTINPINPLLAAGNSVTILAKDQLMFMAFVQGLTVTPTDVISVSVTPQAIDRSNLRVAGPFLGANTFQTFQAVVNVIVPIGFVGTISGMVVGALYLSIG